MILTAHQPNFMPWYPFFQKIEQADVFVHLLNVQYEKNGYQNRFHYNDKWHTMAVTKGKLKDLIEEKFYVNPTRDWEFIKYEFPYLPLDEFNWCIDTMTNKVGLTNVRIINKIIEMLNIKTTVYPSFVTDKKKSERLVELCEHYGCDTYLSGIGAKVYLDEKVFNDKGIKVIYQDETKMIKKPIFDVLWNF